MPERWEREVGKLGTLTAPRLVPARMGEGPHGDGMPPPPRRGQRIAAGIVAFVMFGAVAALTVAAFRGGPGAVPTPASSRAPSAESQLVATLNAPADGSMPDLVLSYDGRTESFFAADGKWPGVEGFPQPIQIFTVSIDPGAMIAVDSDADRLEGRLFVADRDQRLTGGSFPLNVSSGTGALPDDAGYFRLTLVGTWARGSAGFSVGMMIGRPTGSPSPPPVTEGVVPDVVGLDERDAIVALKEAGFVAVGVFAPANLPGGVVISSDPPAGAHVDVETTVTLTVSDGP
jgi:hypothetical protein